MRSAGEAPCEIKSESVKEVNWEAEQLTDSASRRKVLRGSMKAFSFFFAEGLTSGIWPSYICSTTDSGDRLSVVALARISLRVYSRSLTTIDNDPEIELTSNLVPDTSIWRVDRPRKSRNEVGVVDNLQICQKILDLWEKSFQSARPIYQYQQRKTNLGTLKKLMST
jgi:hypothetical protein